MTGVSGVLNGDIARKSRSVGAAGSAVGAEDEYHGSLNQMHHFHNVPRFRERV